VELVIVLLSFQPRTVGQRNLFGRLARSQAVVGVVHESVTDGRLTDTEMLDFLFAGIECLPAGHRSPAEHDPRGRLTEAD
jgi:hypothetical protein